MKHIHIRVLLSTIQLAITYLVTINVNNLAVNTVYTFGLICAILYYIYDAYRLFLHSKLSGHSTLHHIGALVISCYSLRIALMSEQDTRTASLIIFYMARMVTLNTVVILMKNKLIRALCMLFFIPFHIEGAFQCFYLEWEKSEIEVYYRISLVLLIPENIEKISYFLFNYS